VQASDLHLEKVLPYMEETGVIDAAVVLMAREGQLREAMDRLIKHLGTLEDALLGLLNSAIDDMQPAQAEDAAENLLAALQKYTNVGIWLCQGQAKTPHRAVTSPRPRQTSKSSLIPEEELWLDLIDITVQITRKLSASLADLSESSSAALDHDKLLAQLRTLVQRSFTALLTSTSTPSPSGANISFLRILRAFLTRASVSSPNLSDLRAVLASIFSAYAYEESILSLANRLLDKDLFVSVQSATTLRQRGWRPRGSTCEGCGRRVWGPGVSGDVFSKWEERQEMELKRRKERRAALSGGFAERGKGRAHVRNESKGTIAKVGKGSGKSIAAAVDAAVDTEEEDGQPTTDQADQQQDLGPLVVLACRHIYHQGCLEAMQVEDATTGILHDGREFRCPIDG